MEVKIRPLEEKDAYTSVNWRNDPAIWEFTGSKPDREITIEDETAWIQKVIADKKDRRFAILADEDYVGNIYLTGIEDGRAEYHIFIGERSYWGKGVAALASRAIIDYAKNKLKLNEIALSVNENNKSAINLYKRLGFKATGLSEGFIKMELGLAGNGAGNNE